MSVCRSAPYFELEDGRTWTPIGQNDGIEWPELNGLFRRRNVAAARAYFAILAESGVTVLRLMLEYCHHDYRFFEKPAGTFQPRMVQLWDDLFALCEEYGLRVLLTPFDTFWMWRRWDKHPYNIANGGPCPLREEFFTHPRTQEHVNRRLDFVAQRWGATGAIFAWDLWNELHPAYGADSIDAANRFVTGVSAHLRETELRLFGRAHLQTVSTFLPLAKQRPRLAEVIYGHTTLDFASTHFYEEGTIDHPADTVQPAISTGELVREALEQVPAARPFLDTEHGPIHTFKDHRRTLEERFDDEYFRHMQWAHAASGGAGGGMRWPNRKPHSLTSGMRAAQKSLAEFLGFVDWAHFARANWNRELGVMGAVRPQPGEAAVFGSGDDKQAFIWLLRTDSLLRTGMVDRQAKPISIEVLLPWRHGEVTATLWDTLACRVVEGRVQVRQEQNGIVLIPPPLVTDMAIALRRQH